MTIMKPLLILISSTILFSCTQEKNQPQKTSDVSTILKNELNYSPKMVGPGIISTGQFEGHASVTPKMDELYFAIYTNDHAYSTIAYSVKENGDWGKPEIASFSGQYSDGSPALSPDGNKLYFSSRRPITAAEEINSSNDLWYVERDDSGSWKKPIRLENPINSPFNEFSPSVDMNGNLYFCSNRPGGYGDMDVYYVSNDNGVLGDPIQLDSAINSQYHEGNVGVSSDGNLLFIMVQHKPGDFGYDDIHYSLKKEGSWQPVKNLGKIVNTYTYDFSPKVSPDGKTLFFSSRINRDFTNANDKLDYNSFFKRLNAPLNGFGNIYRVEIGELGLE